LKITENLRKSIENRRKSSEIQNPLRIVENHWKSLKPIEHLQKINEILLNIIGNPLKTIENR